MDRRDVKRRPGATATALPSRFRSLRLGYVPRGRVTDHRGEMAVNDAREQIDGMLAAGRPMAEIEDRIEQLAVGRDAKAALWLRACRRTRARRESEEGWRYRQLGAEEWMSG